MENSKSSQRITLYAGRHLSISSILFVVLFITSLCFVVSFAPGSPHFPNPSETAENISLYFRSQPWSVIMCAFFQFIASLALGSGFPKIAPEMADHIWDCPRHSWGTKRIEFIIPKFALSNPVHKVPRVCMADCYRFFIAESCQNLNLKIETDGNAILYRVTNFKHNKTFKP